MRVRRGRCQSFTAEKNEPGTKKGEPGFTKETGLAVDSLSDVSPPHVEFFNGLLTASASQDKPCGAE